MDIVFCIILIIRRIDIGSNIVIIGNLKCMIRKVLEVFIELF